ncbi:hypothetical protein LguiA_012196 [Lonicera macranthoides]
MESDLPLIEIAGEDDSLLITTTTTTTALVHDDTPTSSPTLISYLSCSPLQIPIPNRSSHLHPISSTKALDDHVDRENPTHSSPKSSSNTHKVRNSKVEVPKLSMEPLQMKKRKTGGGYNLRKSLAWDRAFFTEEGVLDPLELSMISGSFGNSCGEALSIISEEGRNSFSGDSDCSTDSADLQSLGGTLRKDFPSPSLRPANVNTTRAAGKKDSKLPKVPIPKPSPSLLPTTARTKSAILSESHLKHNQIAQTAVDVHTNVGLKSFSKNFKGAQNKAKPGPRSLPSRVNLSAQHSGRSLANSPLEAQPSTTLLQLPISKTASCLEVIPNPKVLSTTAYSSEGRNGSTLAVSLSQNTHTIGATMQNRQNQRVRPSGLRMPSPSLGFFGQPKASGLHSVLQKSTQLCNIPKSGTCGPQKFGELRPPYAPGVLKTSTQSALNSVSHKIMKLDLEVNSAQKMELKVPNDCKTSEPIRSKHVVDNIIDANMIIQEPLKNNEMEKIVCKEEAKLQMNDNQVLLQSGSSSSKQLREDKFQNSSTKSHTVVSKSDFGDISYGAESCSTLHDDRVRCIQNLDQPSSDQAELIPCGDVDYPSGDQYSCHTRDGISKLSEESQKCETGYKRNADLINPECSGSELEHNVQENEADGDLDNSTSHSPAVVSKVQAPNEILSVEKCTSNLSTSVVDKQDLKVDDLSGQSEEHLVLKSFCLAVQQNSQRNLELHIDDDFSLAKCSFCEEYPVGKASESFESGLLERNNVNRSESSDSNFFSAQIPGQVQDGRVDMGKMAEPSVLDPENCIDTHFSDDEKFIGEATSSDLDASLSKEPVLLLQSEPTLSRCKVQNTEVNEAKNDLDVEESETNNSIYISHQKSKSTESFHSPSWIQNAEQAHEVAGVVDDVKSSANGMKKDNLVIKPPPDAVPFSDEWLAAIEAAGEDILTMKGGAVQNSPPDKSLPEPSPWSPVKRKNNQIGPFDCTKHTNTLPAEPQ